jgi:hypothetical protein
MTLRASLATSLLVDNVSAYAASTWNTPYLVTADTFDSHILGVSQNGATVYSHTDGAIAVSVDYPATTARSGVPTSVRAAIDQLEFAWCEMCGLAGGSFRAGTLPINLTTVAANFNATNSTANPTANAWGRRDANGRMGFGGVDIVQSQIAVSALVVSGISGALSAGALLVLRNFADLGGGTSRVSVLNDGTVTITGTLSVSGALSAGSLAATSLAAPITFSSAISDYKVVPNGVSGQVQVSAGAGFNDGGGNYVPPKASQNVALANAVNGTQPTAPNIQQVAIVIPAGSNGVPLAIGGPVGVSPAYPAIPTGDILLGMVVWQNAHSVPIAADITDARNPFGGGIGSGGGGGTTDAGVRASLVLLKGTNPSVYPGALDVSNPAANLDIHPALIAASSTEAPYLDLIKYSATANIVDAIAVSGPYATLSPPSNQYIQVNINGESRKISSPITTPVAASGAAGLYNLLADIGTVGSVNYATRSDFGLSWSSQASGSINPNTQLAIATMYFDGVNTLVVGGSGNDRSFIAYPFLPNPIQRPIIYPLVHLGSLNFPTQMIGSGAGNYTALVIPGTTPYTLYLPRAGMRLKLRIELLMTWGAYAATPPDAYIGFFLTNATTIGASMTQSVHLGEQGETASTMIRHWGEFEISALAAGPWTIQPGYINPAANDAAHQMTGVTLYASGEAFIR